MSTASSNSKFVPFKFRELKVYNSTEWLAENQKKYRQVFDRHETTYIYAELSIYNKLFDEADWEVNVELKCFSLEDEGHEVCNLPFTRKISKYDNVVHIREGWGNKKKGAFWKKGTYYWEAWVENKKVSTKYFYIEDAGTAIEKEYNPYVAVDAITLYEGSYDDIPEEQRNYFKVFDTKETRYIYLDIKLYNHLLEGWQCEMFIKFYNDAKELKGQVIRLQRVGKEDEMIAITAGWGSNVKGSWRAGSYTAEVIFMGKLLASVPFEVGANYEEGHPVVFLPFNNNTLQAPEIPDTETFDDVLSKLNGLVGLSEIKQKVLDHSQYVKFLQLRKLKGINDTDNINIHSVFMGNPGTGKTTVAQMMGKLYQKMGLLTKGHVHEVDRVDLVGEYIGQTAPKVREAIEKAKGGVLFIDEAYSLARANDDSKDFGREVIEILIKEMSSPDNRDMAVIVAGYPKEMKHFINSNPGFKSRFKLFYDFVDYKPDELMEITNYACNDKKVVLTKKAKNRVHELVIDAYRNRDRTFGNARYIFDIVEKAKINLGIRIMKAEDTSVHTKKHLKTISIEDINQIDFVKPKKVLDLPIDKQLLKSSLAELDALVGMEPVKKQIKEIISLAQYYRKSGKDVLNKFFMHTVLVGNPGTGKTTIARIITQVYKAIGILERGHVVETDRQGLVAGFVGQTAIKTSEKIDEATGGVLFIDEAYALTNGGSRGQDFGDEAIQTLLKRMEDDRGQFFVFVAGYPDQMESFLKANPGLRSRFDQVVKFEDYNPVELNTIAVKMIKAEGMLLSPKAKVHMKKYLAFIHSIKDQYFGNARTVRKIVLDVIKAQNLRMASLVDEDITNKTAHRTITIDDFKDFTFDKDQFVIGNRATIGFKG